MIKIKLKELLDEKNKTIYWLSKETGITSPALYKIRDNKTDSIKFSVLENICIALNCDIKDILEISN